MGIVEAALRKTMRVGERVDVTLIGGRELRGSITAFGEDGILLKDGEMERPIAFAGIATFLPTRMVLPRSDAQEAQDQPKEDTAGPKEEVTRQEGWIERYESGARMGSIACCGEHALFRLEDVLDQQLYDRLGDWFGRAIPVQFTLHSQGAKKTATGITERRAQEKYEPQQAQEESNAGERYGFGEILHFDKQNGYGKAREGNVKFLFRREDIASAGLWKEILRSPNTCGMKIAFTVGKDGKYTCIRELGELGTPETLTAPDFAAEAALLGEEDDVNPEARTVFTDGTVMEEEVRAGMVMFYNTDKFFGRLRQEDGERYYFRSGDVMQKSLLDFLCQRPPQDVEDTRVTFSVKRLPTGKLAAGRVCWEARKQEGQPKREAQEEPAAPDKPQAPVKVEKKEEPAPLNAYCANYLRAWGGQQDQLPDQLRQVAAACADEEVRREVLLEIVALSDVRKEKRDDAMLGYLRAYAQEGGGEELSGFLSAATYAGAEMFDALTRLFAVSEGAFGRLCGIIAADGELVTLRGEILTRFGSVPETAQQLKDLWRPLVLAERERADCAGLPRTTETLRQRDPEGKLAHWAALLETDAPQDAETLRAAREELLRRPTRLAVEWLMPIVLDAQERASRGEEDAQSPLARPLCALERVGVRYACLEIEGRAEEASVALEDGMVEIGPLEGCLQVALPGNCGEETVKIEGRTGEKRWALALNAAFEETPGDGPRPEEALGAHGVTALCGAGAADALDALHARLAEPQGEERLVLRLGRAASAVEATRGLLTALEGEMRARYGADVAGLMDFPAQEAVAGMEPEALEEALMRVLRDFADLRLVHDRLKGARVVCLVEAQAGVEEIYALAARMRECGVFTALAAEAAPEAAPAEQVMRLDAGTLEQALREAGFAANNLRMVNVRKGEKSDEIG